MVKKKLTVNPTKDPISDKVVRDTITIYGYRHVLEVMSAMAKEAAKKHCPVPSTAEFFELLSRGCKKVVDVCWGAPDEVPGV
jgi:hypothetical protein